MNWNNSWGTDSFTPSQPEAQTALVQAVKQTILDPMARYDAMGQGDVLAVWNAMKETLKKAKDEEMTMRKYIVKRAFPNPDEGVNTVPLENGYQLKAGISFNYNLVNDNEKIEEVLDTIALIGNEGSFIASSIITWSANFHESEYKKLKVAADSGSEFAKTMITEIHKVLIINDAAPKLEIKPPKVKK